MNPFHIYGCFSSVIATFVASVIFHNSHQSTAFRTSSIIIPPTQRQSRQQRTMAQQSHENNWIVRSLNDDDEKVQGHLASQNNNNNNNNHKKPIPTRLILHFDINETILLGDDAGGDSRHDSVQKMLAKSAFCQLPPSSGVSSWEETQQVQPTHWWDGQEMGKETTTMPPLYTGWKWPPNCCPYYRTSYKKWSKEFVDRHHGRIYAPVLQACELALSKSKTGNHILPAFYQTLEWLVTTYKSPFTLCFRTFGSDIQEMASLVTEFAQGRHPDYPHIRYPPLELPPDRLYQGRWKTLEDGSVIYQLWDKDETEVLASGDADILQLLDQVTVCGIRDDYAFWKQNNWNPTAGKPVWIPKNHNTQSCYDHHLFFDDNIHNLPNDGIASVRKQQQDGTFVTMDGATMHEESQGVHLIRVPTIEPVLNPNWYIEQITQAQSRLQARLRAEEEGIE
jgi:hypothetical protein